MKKFLLTECYFCSKLATTKEHIPPKSFFLGRDINPKRLIRVPSCEEHNTDKSADDEYFRNLISLEIHGGDEGIRLFEKKTYKSLSGSPGKYKNILNLPQEVIVNGQKTMKFEVEK